MSAASPQNAQSQRGTLLILALFEERANLTFSRELSRSE